ncbi:MAG: flagellar biosynthesis protein FlgC [Proteobacteria bacterium]|nr:flagellar biosynthesis protein FlgC [Pseudomonadota bacterium]
MVSPVTIALSGLNATSTRVAASASNIANAHTVGAREGTEGPDAYTPVDVVQVSIGAETGELQGTQAEVVERDPATTPAYQPDSPYADSQGLVEAPNVDYGAELINARTAALAYKANLAVIKVADEMERDLLDRLA